MPEDSPFSQEVTSFLPLHPKDYHILFVLLDGACHGYRIVKEIERQTGGQVRMEAGNLYRSIRRMVRDGLVVESDRRPAPEVDDRRRRYYGVTDLGRRVLAAEAARLRAVVAAADAHGELGRSRAGA